MALRLGLGLIIGIYVSSTLVLSTSSSTKHYPRAQSQELCTAPTGQKHPSDLYKITHEQKLRLFAKAG